MNATPPKSVSQIISDGIRSLSTNQKAFAERCGISPALLSMVITGKRKPTPAIVQAIASVLQMDAKELLRADEEYRVWLQTPDGMNFSAQNAYDNLIPKWESEGGGFLLVDHQIEEAIDVSYLGVDPFDKDSIKPAKLDLKRGASIRCGKKFYESHKHDFPIESGQVVEFQTLEKIRMPSQLIARVSLLGELIREGLFASVGVHIDPGWEGHPFVTIANFGGDTYHIDFDQPFVSAEFQYLSASPRSVYAPRED